MMQSRSRSIFNALCPGLAFQLQATSDLATTQRYPNRSLPPRPPRSMVLINFPPTHTHTPRKQKGKLSQPAGTTRSVDPYRNREGVLAFGTRVKQCPQPSSLLRRDISHAWGTCECANMTGQHTAQKQQHLPCAPPPYVHVEGDRMKLLPLEYGIAKKRWARCEGPRVQSEGQINALSPAHRSVRDAGENCRKQPISSRNRK